MLELVIGERAGTIPAAIGGQYQKEMGSLIFFPFHGSATAPHSGPDGRHRQPRGRGGHRSPGSVPVPGGCRPDDAKGLEIAIDVQTYMKRPAHLRPENQTGHHDPVVDFSELQHYDTNADQRAAPP